MRRLLLFCVIMLALMLVGVSCEKEVPKDIAAQTAREYYSNLYSGKYEAFVSGMYFPDSIPDSYHWQLVDNMKMFVAEQKDKHHGVYDVRIARYNTDSVAHATDVFLILCYGDSVNEEIVVRMIEHDGKWLMK